MKVENIKKVSNQYSIIKQVYEDRVLIRTSNVIFSKKYFCYMFILSNNSCIWTNRICDICFGKTQFEYTENGYLVEIRKEDFNRIKTYNNNFNGFNIDEKDAIHSYDKLVELAQEQQDLNLVTKFC